jgi:hypothetical protein
MHAPRRLPITASKIHFSRIEKSPMLATRMKMQVMIAFLMFACAGIGTAQQKSAGSEAPENLKASFQTIQGRFPKLDSKKSPKAPADSAWVFRGAGSESVEVGFQGKEILYMILRSGIGSAAWTPQSTRAFYEFYAHSLLHEPKDHSKPRRYKAECMKATGRGVIVRKDLDAKVIGAGL